MDNGTWYLVDLPGYGYAARGKEQREGFGRIIQDYILNRQQLTCLFVLIDIRHDPQKIDVEFLRWLGENGVPFAIVFTKADKLGPNAGASKVASYKKFLLNEWEELPPIFVTSSENRTGRDELLEFIYSTNRKMEEDESVDIKEELKPEEEEKPIPDFPDRQDLHETPES